LLIRMALKMQCHVVENTLLQIAFSAFLPTGQNIKIEFVKTYFDKYNIILLY